MTDADSISGRDDPEKVTWEEAQQAVKEFRHGEIKAITPMAGEMVVLYDQGRYGPNGQNSPPNVELITKADSIWETWTDDGSMSFHSIMQKYPVEVLREEDLSHTSSETKSKAYVGIPKGRIEDTE
jgi:acyl-CoA-binding protein